MENRPIIKKEQVETVYDSRFIKVFDLQYEPGKHYFDATRRAKDNLAAVKSDEEFRQMLPDAVSCVVILKIRGQEPRLCLSREYRYPAGHFLLSVPAGLLDPEVVYEQTDTSEKIRTSLIQGIAYGNGAVDIEQEKLFIFQTSQLCGIAVNVLRVKSIHNYPHF